VVQREFRAQTSLDVPWHGPTSASLFTIRAGTLRRAQASLPSIP
jgi:hypothetical protein